MAEGGYDPDETGTFDPNKGADDRTSLLHHHHEEEIEMEHMTSTPTTSTSRQTWQHTEETSFGGTPSETMEMRIEAVDTLKKVFHEPDTTKFYAEIGRDGEVLVRLKSDRNKLYPILKNGEVLFNKDGKYIDDNGNAIKDKNGRVVIVPKTIRNALGKTVIEIAHEKIAENTVENERAEERIRERNEQIPNAVGEEQKRLMEENRRDQEGINERNQDNQAIEERLTLRQRIKEIFKKYGFSAFAVMTAIGTVIGVIVSNLKAGLTKVAKGVGNGLKELGEKTR